MDDKEIKNFQELCRCVRQIKPHFCEVCDHYIPVPMTSCFAHILGKGMNREYEFYSNNIALVCGIDCHREVDRRVAGSKYEIEQIIKDGKFVNIKEYKGKKISLQRN